MKPRPKNIGLREEEKEDLRLFLGVASGGPRWFLAAKMDVIR